VNGEGVFPSPFFTFDRALIALQPRKCVSLISTTLAPPPGNMNKFLLSITAFTGLTLSGPAQGVIAFNGSRNSSPSPTASSSGEVFLGGLLDTTQDINAELLYGTSPANVSVPVVTLLVSSSNHGTNAAIGQTLSAVLDISFYHSGVLSDPNGWNYVIPNIPAGITGYFLVEGWTGNYGSYAAAAASSSVAVGQTAVFSELLQAPLQIPLGIGNMPALDLVIPEPSSLLMAGIGIGSMLALGSFKMIRF
jgi:hypothetical protein